MSLPLEKCSRCYGSGIILGILILSGCAKKIALQSSAADAVEFEIFPVVEYRASTRREGENLRWAMDNNMATAWASTPGTLPAWFQMKFGRTVALRGIKIYWAEEAAKSYEILVSKNGSKWKKVEEVDNGKAGETRRLTFSRANANFLRIQCIAPVAEHYAIRELELNPAEAPPKIKAWASSAEADGAPEKAIDGDSATRWSSEQAKDPSWIAFDFGKEIDIGSVKLKWEKASAQVYEIQSSIDGEKWNTLTGVDDGAESETRMLRLPEPATTKFLRLFCKKRTTQWGYSLWEIELFSPGFLVIP